MLLILENYDVSSDIIKNHIKRLLLHGKNNPSFLEIKGLGKADGCLFLSLLLVAIIEKSHKDKNVIFTLKQQLENMKNESDA